nr:ABC transporter ATP-binding protein [Yokenella regensburgei]
MMGELRIQQLSCGYGKTRVFTNLQIPALPQGEISVLLGPNGCGKSTLLRALAGLNLAQGDVLLAGNNLMTMPFAERSRRVVFLPQSLPQGVHLHVLESVIVAMRAGGGRTEGNEMAHAQAILRQLGIAHLAMHYLDQLSGGQKQLVGLAQSLVRQPELLLLDEPLSALDLNYQLLVMEQIARETRARRIVTVVVLHDMNIALRHGSHIVMLKDGQLVACGRPEEVVTSATLAEVYGVRGRVERTRDGQAHVVLEGLVSA